ncbi:hypothetical protein [Helicobacter sp. 16-1353]|uniref:hypothetical protein n=1 Tax=Helicobacter sp. 16-1353 TaxID=2004996 RepID=UPI0015EF3973|nr:hypothetical protein [Helicobacter sp. 16-1353]
MMKKVALEDFIKQPKDSDALVTLNESPLFIFVKDTKEILQIIKPKKLSAKESSKCTEK